MGVLYGLEWDDTNKRWKPVGVHHPVVPGDAPVVLAYADARFDGGLVAWSGKGTIPIGITAAGGAQQFGILAAGSNGAFLVMDSTQTTGAKWDTVVTTKGDLMIYGNGQVDRLAVGSNNKVLVADSSQGKGLLWDTVKTASLQDDAVTDAKLRNSGALSVIGRSANSSGDPADISASAASGAVLRESGSTVGFGTVATAGIADDAITYAKMQNVANSRLLGRDGVGAGDPQEITVGGGLSFSGSAALSSKTVANDTLWDAANDYARGSGADTAVRQAASAATPAAVGTSGSTGTAANPPSADDHVHAHEAAHINHDTTWAAKGDLIVGTANDAAAVLGVGTNGYVPVADSSQTTGIAWEAKTAGIQSADVTTSETTTSTGYTDLATDGPSVSVTAGKSGIILVVLSVKLSNSANGNNTIASVRKDADSMSSADDVNGVTASSAQTTTGERATLYTGLTPGQSYTFKIRYRVAAGTGTYQARRIMAVPL